MNTRHQLEMVPETTGGGRVETMAGGTWDEDVLPLKCRVAPPPRSISIVPVIGVVAHDPINTCRGLLPSNFLELETEQRW